MSKSVKHYQEWLRFTIHLETKISLNSNDLLRIQVPPERPGSDILYSVSPEKERNQKGRKPKVYWILQWPVFSTQAPPKVEAGQ